MGTNGKTGNVKILEISFKHKGEKVKTKHFVCECDQTLGYVAQRGVGVSILGDTETSVVTALSNLRLLTLLEQRWMR